MTEQEIIAIIENYLANNLQKTKVSQLPQAASLDNLQILGVSGSQSVRAAMSLLKGLDGKNPELRKNDTHIQWRVTDGTWADLIALADLKGLKILLEKSGDVVNYKYEGDANWQLLFSLADLAGDNAYEVAVKNGFVGTETQWLASLKGEPFKYSDFTQQQLDALKGAKGDEVSLQITATHIQWRLGTGSWSNLIALSDLKGGKGDDGSTPTIQGGYWYINGASTGVKAQGTDGLPIELQKTATYLQWRVQGTSTWSNLILLEELKVKGDTGASIELQVTATYIQWRVQGTSTWSNLIALSELKGAQGNNIELQKTTTHLQWRVVGGSWANLVALSELKGDTGQGLPTGGAAGQVLVKKSGTNYDYEWQTPAGAGDMLKSVYDPSNKNGDAFSQDNMKDGTANKNFTSTEKTKLAGIESEAQKNTVNSVAGKTGAVTLSKSDVGLSNVDNTSDANKPVSTAQSTAINAKYTKPGTGIPKTDLASAVQTSLNKADSALQSYTETDPTVPAWAKAANKPSYSYDELTGTKPPSNAQKNSDITKAEIEAKLTGAISSHTHSGYVATSGNETIAGTKTFSTIPVLPASNPTTANQAVRKQYVDDSLTAKLDTAKIQLVSSLPGSPVAGTLYLIPE